MIVACPQCGTLQELAPLRPRSTAFCAVCEHLLERTSGRSLTAALACSSATLILLVPANALPFLSVSLLDMHRVSRLGSGVVDLWNHQWALVALLVAAFAIVLPFVRYALLSAVLAAVVLGRKPRGLGRVFRWTLELDPWSMLDVFLLGLAVGYSRILATLPVTIGWGGFCFIAAAFLSMLSRAALDERTVWEAIAREHPARPPTSALISCTACNLVAPAEHEGAPCPRCSLRLRGRKPDAFVRTLTLMIAGLVLYIPANVYPMSTDTQLGQLVRHRIIDGIVELYQAGLWPLGILIFCTSIAIPFLKLAGLGWFLVSIRRKSSRRLRAKTRLYRVVDEIGRWSNTDVFTIAVFLPVLQFGAIASSQAALGTTAFILVVIFTMLASRAFDPRLMWDAGLEGAE